MIKPMLACSKIPDLDTEVTWPKYISPKLDGIRCLVNRNLAVSRNLKPIPNNYVRGIVSNFYEGLDGELMLIGPDNDFNNVQSAFMSFDGKPMFEYHVFDVVDPETPFEQRLDRLHAIIPDDHEYIKVVPQFLVHNAKQARHYWDLFVEEGYEGAILKDPAGPYKFGRSTPKQQYMSKLKTFMDNEATVIGFEELMHNENNAETGELGQTKRSSEQAGMVPGNTLGALIVGWNGKQFKIGTGFDSAERKRIWERRGSLLQTKVTFKYQELSKYGIPRFPVFKGFRDKADL